MARIRAIKPEFFTDEVLCDLPVTTRYTYAGLWTYCDDAGRGLDNVSLVKAAVWPLDAKHTEKKVAQDLDQLAAAGRICRYEALGRKVFHVVKWEHQKINRPTPTKLPPCPAHDSISEEPSPDSVSETVNGSVSDTVNGSRTTHSARVRKGKEGKGKEELLLAATPLAAAPPPDSPPAEDPAQRLTRHWVGLVPMSNWPAVHGIVRRALTAGHDPADVEAALTRLAADRRSLTVETLRVELDGRPPPRSPAPSPGNDKLAALDRGYRLAEGGSTRDR